MESSSEDSTDEADQKHKRRRRQIRRIQISSSDEDEDDAGWDLGRGCALCVHNLGRRYQKSQI